VPSGFHADTQTFINTVTLPAPGRSRRRACFWLRERVWTGWFQRVSRGAQKPPAKRREDEHGKR